MKKFKTFCKRCLLLFFSTIFVLIITELVLRWDERRSINSLATQTANAVIVSSDIPGLYYTLRPGVSNASLNVNSLGFNMTERSGVKPPGGWRIVVVGDSFTQGGGADRREDAYPNRLESNLHANPSYTNVEVWNCGVGGYNVDQAFLMLTRIATNYHPDAVIYGFCFNDYWGPNQYAWGQPGRPPGSNVSIGLLDSIKALRTITLAKQLYDRGHYSVHGYLPTFVDRKISYPSWTAMKQRIAEMRDFCVQNGWPFAVNIMPMPQFIYVDEKDNLALHDLRAFLKTNNIAYCDATEVLRLHSTEKIFKHYDTHPNSRGYELIAGNLTGWILSNKVSLLPSR